MNFFTIMTKWFWIACIAAMCLNAGIFHFRSRRYINKNPDLINGYRTLIRGFLFWGNIPWIVMGVGCVLGGIPSVFHFFRPSSGDPFVLAFFASVFLIWILAAFWLLFRGGAEMLVMHPGLFKVNFKNPLMVKLYWFLCLAGGIAGLVVMFTMDIPVPT